jgi:hypothetical protein
MPAAMGNAGVQTLGMVMVCKEERATPLDCVRWGRLVPRSLGNGIDRPSDVKCWPLMELLTPCSFRSRLTSAHCVLNVYSVIKEFNSNYGCNVRTTVYISLSLMVGFC